MIKILIIGFLFDVVVQILSFVMMFIIQNKIITKMNLRKLLIKCFETIQRMGLLIKILNMVVVEIVVLLNLYKMNYLFISIISDSEELASYIALSLALISSVPIVVLVLKIIKRKQYFGKEKGNNFIIEIDESGVLQSVFYDYVNKSMELIYKIPFLGIIHIINLGLVIWANVAKSLDMNTNITTTSIYMGIATFYAADKVFDYFKKKYSKFLKWLDNRIFLTEEINKEIKLDLQDIKNIISQLYDNYIYTGKYVMTDEILNSFKEKINNVDKQRE